MLKKFIHKILEHSRFQITTKLKSANISPQQAHRIQQQDYTALRKKNEKSCTPPFEIIARQLEHKTDVVFESSVYYLCRIAANEPQYQQKIMNILKKYKTTHKNEHNRLNFIDNIIKSHKV